MNDMDLFSLVRSQVVQVTATVVIVWLLVQLFARKRSHLAFALWMVVLLKCLTPPLLSSPVALFGMLPTWEFVEPEPIETIAVDPIDPMEFVEFDATEPVEIDPLSRGYEIDSADAFLESYEPSAEPIGVEVEAKTIATSEPLVPPLWKWWLVSASVVFVLAFLRVVWVLRGVKKAKLETPTELAGMVESLRGRLKIRRGVRICVTARAVGPAVVGLLRPLLILPEAILQNRDSHDLEPILAHELLHIRRGDLGLGWLQLLAQSVWWFHPLVWLAGKRLTRETERCCDEAVLAELNCTPAHYARCLLHVLEQKRKLSPIPAFPGVKRVELTKQRMERIMKLGQGCRKRTPAWCWLVVLILGAVILPGQVMSQTEPMDVKPTEDIVLSNVREFGVQIAEAEPEPRTVRMYAVGTLLDRIAKDFELDEEQSIKVLTNLLRTSTKQDFVAPIPQQKVPPRQKLITEFIEFNGAPTLVIAGTTKQHQIVRNAIDVWTKHGLAEVQVEVRIATCSDEGLVSLGETIPRESGETVAMDDKQMHNVIQTLQGDARSNILLAPKMTLYHGTRGQIVDQTIRPFVTAIENGKPKVETISEGTLIDVRPVATPSGSVELVAQFEFSQILDVKIEESGEIVNGKPAKIQKVDVHRDEIQTAGVIPSGKSLVIRGPRQAESKRLVKDEAPGSFTDALLKLVIPGDDEREIVVPAQNLLILITPRVKPMTREMVLTLSQMSELNQRQTPKAEVDATVQWNSQLGPRSYYHASPADAEQKGKMTVHAHDVVKVLGGITIEGEPGSNPQPLIDLIKKSIAPTTWGDPKHGPYLKFDQPTCSLVIRHEKRVQEEIAALLKDPLLRTDGDSMHVEVWLRAPENCRLETSHKRELQINLEPGREYKSYVEHLTVTETEDEKTINMTRYPLTLKLAPLTDATRENIRNFRLPIQIVGEDLEQVAANNSVIKVYYLTKAHYHTHPEAEERSRWVLETIVSTRLNPSLSPIEEAKKRGEIVAVVQLDSVMKLHGFGVNSDAGVRGEVLLNQGEVAERKSSGSENAKHRWEKPFSITFQNETLLDAFRKLSQLSGIPIEIDGDALESVGIKRNLRVNYQGKERQFIRHLGGLLRPLGVLPVCETYLHDGQPNLKVVGIAKHQFEEATTIVYPVADLIVPVHVYDAQSKMYRSDQAPHSVYSSYSDPLTGTNIAVLAPNGPYRPISKTEPPKPANPTIDKIPQQSKLFKRLPGTNTGVPITGAPIGLPGPPHIPIGQPAVSGPGPGVLSPPRQKNDPTQTRQFNVSPYDNVPAFEYPKETSTQRPRDCREQAERLIQLIKQTLLEKKQPMSDDDSIAFFSEKLSLVVRATRKQHDIIAELLSTLRRQQDVQVTLECTTVAFEREYFEKFWDYEGIEFNAAASEVSRMSPLVLHSVKRDDFFSKLKRFKQAKIVSAPKVTVFDGVSAQIQIGAQVKIVDGTLVPVDSPDSMDYLFVAKTSEDRRSVDVKFVLNATNVAEVLSKAKSFSIPDGETVLFEVTDDLIRDDKSGTVPGVDRAIREMRTKQLGTRTFILLTPRIIVQEEEEVLMLTPSGIIEEEEEPLLGVPVEGR